MPWLEAGRVVRRWGWGALLVGALSGCSSELPPAVVLPGPDDAGVDLGPDLLPCDVKTVLADRCASCHTTPLKGSAPMALLARSDFQKASPLDPQSTLGARSLVRIRDTASPMPPSHEPSLKDAERAVLEAWFEAGMPAGTCDSLAPGPAPTTCASGSYWSEASGTGSSMAPGYACRSCHLQQAPSHAYFFMGTVFKTLHEENGCDARLQEPSKVRVEILDAQDQVRLTLVPNFAGNFYSPAQEAGFPLPYRVRLVGPDGRSRMMRTLQTQGDCNSCHTEQGAEGAPGRIALP
jgi:mono/diheme cytochrome c family protein